MHNCSLYYNIHLAPIHVEEVSFRSWYVHYGRCARGVRLEKVCCIFIFAKPTFKLLWHIEEACRYDFFSNIFLFFHFPGRPLQLRKHKIAFFFFEIPNYPACIVHDKKQNFFISLLCVLHSFFFTLLSLIQCR